jgi:hypothetical protein
MMIRRRPLIVPATRPPLLVALSLIAAGPAADAASGERPARPDVLSAEPSGLRAGAARRRHAGRANSIKRCVLALCLFLCGVAAALAQQDQGSITGIVTDGTGAALPGATVTARDKGTGVVTTTVTNSSGAFTLTPLKIGGYAVAAAMDGFRSAEFEDVSLHAQSRVRLDFKLELGPRAEKIVVTHEAPLLEKESPTLAHVIQEREIRGLPLNTRNFQFLAVLAPGVLPAQGHRDQEGGFNAHGQWATQNNFILDGIDNNSQILGLEDRKAQVLVPSLDAVQEFSIQTSNYSAEFGRNAGAVMNVSIKSGTNELHGTAYDFIRDDVFDSRDAFDYNDRDGDGKPDPEELNQHQLGFTIGGPIVRNKTFFFASVEVLRTRSSESVLATVPTPGERQGIFDPRLVTLRDPATGGPFPDNTVPRSRWDPVAANLVNLWPQPNFSGPTRENYTASIPHTRDRYQYDVRVDHDFSGSDKAFLRFSYMDNKGSDPGPFPLPAVGAQTSDQTRSRDSAQSLVVSQTHFFSPTLINEARFGLSRLVVENIPFSTDHPNERYGLKVPFDPTITGLTRLTFTGGLPYTLLGEAAFNPLYKVSKTWQFLDNLTLLKGKHALKAGVDFRWLEAFNDGIAQTRGVFNFNGKFTGASLADFLLGMTNSRQLSTRQLVDLREQDYLFYLLDNWRVSSKLAISLGLRYELSSPMYDAQNRASTLDLGVYPAQVKVIKAAETGNSWSDRALVDTDTNNLAPRIGFAWQAAHKWTIRGAGGIFFGTTGGGLGASSRPVFNWPFFRNVTANSTPTVSAGQLRDGIADDFLGTPTTMPGNLAWQVWSRDFQLPTIGQWNLSVQRQLTTSTVLTMSYVGSATRHLPRAYNINNAPIGPPATERQRRPVPSLGNVTLREPSGSSSYNGLETTLDKRFSRGVRFTLSHTWSHSIDDVQELFGAEGGVVQDTRNLAGDRGSSGFDRRHRISGSWLVELPVGRGRRFLGRGGVANAILGGWDVSGLLSWQTGRVFDVSVPDPTTSLGVSSSNWRADRVPGVDPYAAKRSTQHWIVRDAFAIPRGADGAFRFGNMARNSLVGPRYFNLDLGLAKTVRLWADNKLQLRVEAFNATNHPSYGLPVSNIASPDFGKIASTASTPRQLQFGVKFVY